MRFLVCVSEANPCPPEAQQWSTTAEILDPVQFGITPETITKVATWGFSVVLLGFLLGYVLGIALGLIRKV
jgi:hypothetical protein